MKTVFNQKLQLAALLSIVLLLITSSSPQIKLTSSWTNKQAKVKSAPSIMVMVLGKANSTTRQDVENNIDMLLTSTVISITENERFIPGAVQGTDIVVPTGGYITPYSPYNGAYVGYNNYYNYYGSYQTIEAPPTPGTTVKDVLVIIESNLYNVDTPELIWYGQSRSSTK